MPVDGKHILFWCLEYSALIWSTFVYKFFLKRVFSLPQEGFDTNNEVGKAEQLEQRGSMCWQRYILMVRNKGTKPGLELHWDTWEEVISGNPSSWDEENEDKLLEDKAFVFPHYFPHTKSQIFQSHFGLTHPEGYRRGKGGTRIAATATDGLATAPPCHPSCYASGWHNISSQGLLPGFEGPSILWHWVLKEVGSRVSV